MKEQNKNMSDRRAIGRKASTARSRLGTPLPREAERLLVRLGHDGAYALPDPSALDDLILRDGGDGVSLGGGRVGRAAGEALLSAGLAAYEGVPAKRLVISAAGRSRLRRAAGPDANPYAAQHLELVSDRPEGTLRDVCESPLAWLARRRGRDGRTLINAASFEAGERLRRDLSLGAIMPRVTSDWSATRVDGGGPRDPGSAPDAMLAARQRVEQALKAVGSDLAGLLIDLCGFLKGLERIEAERGWPARSGKVVVRMALGRLAEHYGLAREAVGPDRGRLRLWRANA